MFSLRFEQGFSFGGTVPEDQLDPFIQEAADQVCVNFIVSRYSLLTRGVFKDKFRHRRPIEECCWYVNLVNICRVSSECATTN